jgi:hypothetical protein
VYMHSLYMMNFDAFIVPVKNISCHVSASDNSSAVSVVSTVYPSCLHACMQTARIAPCSTLLCAVQTVTASVCVSTFTMKTFDTRPVCAMQVTKVEKAS